MFARKLLDMSKLLGTLRARFTERRSFHGRAAMITMRTQFESTIGIKAGMQLLLPAILGLSLLAPSILHAQSIDRPEPPDWFAGDAQSRITGILEIAKRHSFVPCSASWIIWTETAASPEHGSGGCCE